MMAAPCGLNSADINLDREVQYFRSCPINGMTYRIGFGRSLLIDIRSATHSIVREFLFYTRACGYKINRFQIWASRSLEHSEVFFEASLFDPVTGRLVYSSTKTTRMGAVLDLCGLMIRIINHRRFLNQVVNGILLAKKDHRSIEMTNELSETIKLDCGSEDDDLGTLSVKPGHKIVWSFPTQEETWYECEIWAAGGRHKVFEIFPGPKMIGRKKKTMFWMLRFDGIYEGPQTIRYKTGKRQHDGTAIIMRALLALFIFFGPAIGKEIALNLPCNNELDGLLAQDPEGNESAFLQCIAVEGVNGIGFWERKFCPNNMVFDFVGQQCKDEEKRHWRKEPNKFNIAILNNSCARGEQCIGGTVCDLETLRCLCPYGTQADLDTLSCITPGMPSQFSAFAGGFKQPPAQFGSNVGGGNIDVGFLPNAGQPPQTQMPFNFNFNMNNHNKMPPVGMGTNQGIPDFLQPTGNSGMDFKPNPFVIPPAPMSKKVPILAAPGRSCKDGELCTGGSLCTRPLGMCLCPGDLEERQGECVLPERAAIHIGKVGIGAICGELAECDHGSTCVNGRCMCVSPLIQEDGRCIMQPQLKEVGPGELCDNGEVCIKGSICDTVIPVCVCPTDTDLRDGECVRMKQSNFVRPLPPIAPWATKAPAFPAPPSSAIPLVPVQPFTPPPQKPMPIAPPVQPYQPPVSYTTEPPFRPLPVFPTAPPPIQQPLPPRPLPTRVPERPTYNTQRPTYPTQAPIITTPRPAFKTAAPNPDGPQSYRAINAPPSQAVKQNIIKLGGSKQAGVGVRCALNTDCMVGAYCNGNTNPPSCQCLSTHVNVDGKCEKVIYPGQIGCFTDVQCSSAYVGTKCFDRICVCPQGQKAVDQTCVPINEVVTSPPGGSCSGERECTGGAICREGWCVCPHSTMIVQKGICVQTQPRPTVPPRATAPPQTTAKAFPTFPTAPPTVYTQPPTRQPVAVGRKATPGSQCGPLDTCVGGSMCVEGYCLCPAGTHAGDLGRCVATAAATTTPYPAPAGGNVLRVRPQTAPPQPPPVFASLPTRRPPAASIEVPLTPSAGSNPVPPPRPSPNDNNDNDDDDDDAECRAIGLICKGNTVCRNRSCQCPDGHVLLGDACVLPENEKKASRKGKSWSPANSAKYARPMDDCSNGETCIGGAECAELSDGTTKCICPMEKPIAKGDYCVADQAPVKRVAFPGANCDENTVCAKGSMCQNGICRCPSTQVAIGGVCVTPPPVTAAPTAAPATRTANPFESCEEGEICSGGSSCDEDTGRCMCPIGQIVMLNECKYPPTTPKMPVAKSVGCQSDSECGAERVCVVGACKCRPGFVDFSGKCEPLEAVEVNERPAPVSFARHKVQSLAREEEVKQFSSMPSLEVKIGGKCSPFDDCLRGSECINGICKCPPTTQLEKGECVREHRKDIAFPGDSCALGQLCAGGSICDNDSSKCICGAGFIKMGRRCNSKEGPRYASPGDMCGDGEECSGGSVCYNGRCICDAQHYASSGYCRPIGSPNSDVRLDGNGLRFSSKQVPDRKMAQDCNPFECRLPECFCSRSGKEPPGGLKPEQIPQFVVLTFDDSVNGRTLPDYKKLFENDRWFNPNGCPIRGTFFVSHEWTNYDGVQWIHRKGHEIASNSITHSSLENEDTRRWLGEMDGMRRMLSKFGGADESEVVGMRGPQLATGGDAQFEMMKRAGFLYDNTMTINPGLDSPPFWPQTLDYRVAFACNDNNCPTKSFPGVWEIPINQFYGGYMKQIDSHRRASMIRAATHLDASENELVDMLMSNFERAHHSNKAPYILTLNADFLQLNNTDVGMKSFVRFMDEVSKNKDVYFVTLEQLVKWMQRPTTIAEAANSDALRCRRAFSDLSRGNCSKPNKCMYRTPGLNSPEHQFLTCAPCPDVYPWLENPVGTI
ncbi:unnamed protein product, partial [Mesorhabditis spiculigera]